MQSASDKRLLSLSVNKITRNSEKLQMGHIIKGICFLPSRIQDGIETSLGYGRRRRTLSASMRAARLSQALRLVDGV